MTAESQLFQLLERQNRPFLMVDMEGRLIQANRALETALGFEPGELSNSVADRINFHTDPQPRHRRFFRDLEPYVEMRTLKDAEGNPQQARVQGFPLLDTDGSLYLGEAVELLDSHGGDNEMIGHSPAFEALRTSLAQAAAGNAPVLLNGQTGSGKELAARFVHARSPRAKGPFVVVDCTVLTEELFESEMFGHLKGAFTGAASRKHGLFQLANGGTLFLDEIGELPLSQQPKLLRALESGTFRPVGATDIIQADVRLVSATHQDLEAMARAGDFRQDLFYRVAVVPLTVPPLRERREDIADLAEHLLRTIGQASGREARLSGDALAKLTGYDFPGNIRELRNLLHLGATLSPDGEITGDHIRLPSPPAPASDAPAAAPPPGMSPVEAAEISYLTDLLQRHGGSRKRVAANLNISERTLYRKLKRYGLNQPR
jgi:two-component system response regulator AtoC